METHNECDLLKWTISLTLQNSSLKISQDGESPTAFVNLVENSEMLDLNKSTFFYIKEYTHTQSYFLWLYVYMYADILNLCSVNYIFHIFSWLCVCVVGVCNSCYVWGIVFGSTMVYLANYMLINIWVDFIYLFSPLQIICNFNLLNQLGKK